MRYKTQQAWAALRRSPSSVGGTFDWIDASTIRYNRSIVEAIVNQSSGSFDLENPIIGIVRVSVTRKGSAQ